MRNLKQEIIDAKRDGLTHREAAVALAISTGTVSYHLKNEPKTPKIRKMIALYDMQIPEHDPKAIASICRYIAQNEWDICLLGGDFLDFDFISSFNKGFLRLLEGRSFRKQYKIGTEVLDQIESALDNKSKKAERIFLEGNHEYRVVRYLDANPQMEGYVEVPVGLDLEKRGWKWIPSWSEGKVFRVGKANFIHGLYATKYHANKHVEQFGCNIFYGHTHDIQSHSKIQRGDNKTMMGQSLGCLCKYGQSWMRNRPSNWQQAFGVFYIQPNGLFQCYIPQIFNGGFIAPDGKVY